MLDNIGCDECGGDDVVPAHWATRPSSGTLTPRLEEFTAASCNAILAIDRVDVPCGWQGPSDTATVERAKQARREELAGNV